MSRQVEFNNLDDCSVQVAIPAEWLDPLSAALDLVYRSLRDQVEDPSGELTDKEKERIETLRGYYFSLWTRMDTLAMEFKKWLEQRGK